MVKIYQKEMPKPVINKSLHNKYKIHKKVDIIRD